MRTLHPAETVDGLERFILRKGQLLASETAPVRVAFELSVRGDRISEYIARHTPVWPEMLAEIAASGRRNYSLFLAEGSRVIGYYETNDDPASRAYLASSEVAARWEAEMAPFFLGQVGRVDQADTALVEIFNLSSQLTDFNTFQVDGESHRLAGDTTRGP